MLSFNWHGAQKMGRLKKNKDEFLKQYYYFLIYVKFFNLIISDMLSKVIVEHTIYEMSYIYSLKKRHVIRLA